MYLSILIGLLIWVFPLLAQDIKAIDYNDAIVEKQLELGGWMKNFAEQLQKKKIRDAEQTLNILNRLCRRHLEAIKAMPPYKGDHSLKEAAVGLFELYESVLNNEYQAILAEYRSAEVRGNINVQKVNKLLEDIKIREATSDKNFLDAQKTFSRKFGFTLKENSLAQPSH